MHKDTSSLINDEDNNFISPAMEKQYPTPKFTDNQPQAATTRRTVSTSNNTNSNINHFNPSSPSKNNTPSSQTVKKPFYKSPDKT